MRVRIGRHESCQLHHAHAAERALAQLLHGQHTGLAWLHDRHQHAEPILWRRRRQPRGDRARDDRPARPIHSHGPAHQRPCLQLLDERRPRWRRAAAGRDWCLRRNKDLERPGAAEQRRAHGDGAHRSCALDWRGGRTGLPLHQGGGCVLGVLFGQGAAAQRRVRLQRH